MTCINRNYKDNQRLINDFSEVKVSQMFDKYYKDVDNPSYEEFISNPNVKKDLGIVPISKVKDELGQTFPKQISQSQLIKLKSLVLKINNKLTNELLLLFNLTQVGQSDLYNWGLRKVKGNLDIQAKLDRAIANAKNTIASNNKIKELKDKLPRKQGDLFEDNNYFQNNQNKNVNENIKYFQDNNEKENSNTDSNQVDELKPFIDEFNKLEEQTKFDENGQGLLFGNLQELSKSNRIAVGEIKSENKKIIGFEKKQNPYLRDYNTDLTELEAKKIFNKANKTKQDFEQLALYFSNMFVNEIINKDVHLQTGYNRLLDKSQQKPKILITDSNKKNNPFYQYNNTIVVGIYQLQQLLENGNYNNYQKFTNLIQSVAQEEAIHLFADYLLDKETIDSIYKEMSNKDVQKIKDIYENENLSEEAVVHEYIRMAVQQHVFNSTTEQEKIKLNNSILAFISKMIEEIQQFLTDIIGNNETKKAIENVINFTKGNFSEELDQKIINRIFEQGIRLESNLEQTNIPFQQFQEIKPGVAELFESNFAIFAESKTSDEVISKLLANKIIDKKCS